MAIRVEARPIGSLSDPGATGVNGSARSSATRYGRKQRHLVAGPDGSFAGCGLAVDPDPTCGNQLGEGGAVLGGCRVDQSANGALIKVRGAVAGCFSYRCEQSKCGHQSEATVGVVTDILLIRHGQSEWNAQGRWQGQADPPLSPLGRDQARAAGLLLSRFEPFDGVASSTLDRAATTADLVGEALDLKVAFRTWNISERDAGEWSGLTRDEIDVRYPGYLKNGKYPTGYEYDDTFIVRIHQGLTEIVTNVQGDRLVVVAHGGVIYCLEASLGLPFRHMSNLGARWLSIDANMNVALGDRVDLLDEFDGETTTPTVI